jgi:hypothetical protein
MTSIWNFFRYVSIGINGTNNNDQSSGEDFDRIENISFNANKSNISNSNSSELDDKGLQIKLRSPSEIITSLTDVDEKINIDTSNIKQDDIQFCRELDDIIDRHRLSCDAANEIRTLTERFTQGGKPRKVYISNNQIVDTTLNGLHYIKLEEYISSQDFLIDIESCAQRFAPELISIRKTLKRHSETGLNIIDFRKIIQYMNDIRHPSKKNTNRMNLVKFIAKFWDSCQHVDTDNPGNYKYFMLYNEIANYVTDSKQFLSHLQLYHAYPMFSPFDVQYVLITKIKNKYNYIPSPKRIKI